MEATAGCRFGLILQLKRFLNFNTNSGFAKSHSPRIFLYTTSKPVSKQNASAKIILLWLKPQLPKMSLSEFLEERSWVHNPNPKCKQNSWFILIITGLLCYYLAFQRSILIGNDLHSFAFYNTGRKNGFTRVAKLQQMCSKYHICTSLRKSKDWYCTRFAIRSNDGKCHICTTFTSWCKDNGQPWIWGSFADGSNV